MVEKTLDTEKFIDALQRLIPLLADNKFNAFEVFFTSSWTWVPEPSSN